MRTDQLKSGASFWIRQYCVYEPQKQPKNQSSSLKNGIQFVFFRECRYHLIVRTPYRGLCSPSWKLKVIRDLNRKNCWIFETNGWCCSDNKNYKLWTPPSTGGPPAKKVVDEMQWNPAISLNTNTRITWLIRKTNTFLCPESQTVI